MKKRPADTPRTGRKKYQKPRLTDYGDLRHIVQVGKASNRGDGRGVPATKR